jgi:hypothetical protein
MKMVKIFHDAKIKLEVKFLKNEKSHRMKMLKIFYDAKI